MTFCINSGAFAEGDAQRRGCARRGGWLLLTRAPATVALTSPPRLARTGAPATVGQRLARPCGEESH